MKRMVLGVLLTAVCGPLAASCGSGSDSPAAAANGATGSGGMGAGATGSGGMGAGATGSGGAGAAGGEGGSAASGGSPVGVGSGGGPPNGVIENASGSRLVWRRMQTSDGVGMGGEWFDSLRNETCEFRRTTEGKYRCLPPAHFNAPNAFLDANCTMPLASYYVVQGVHCEKFTAKAGAGCSFDVDTIYPLGMQVSPQYVYTGSSCTQELANSGVSYFPALSPLVMTDWVAATEQVDSGSARIRPRYRLGEDGSREFAGWFDDMRQDPCFLSVAADSQRRCLPSQPPLTPILTDDVVYYSDAQCTTEVYQSSFCASPGEKYAGRRKDSCTEELRIHLLGAPTTAVYGWNSFIQMCTMVFPLPGQPGLEIGTEIPATTFEAAQIVDEPGTGRLRRRLLVTASGAARPFELFDTLLQQPCKFWPSEDGSIRCLPNDAWGADRYSDPQCTSRVLEFEPSGCLAGSPVPKYASDYDNSVCPTRWLRYEVGSPITATTLYDRLANGTCVDDGPPSPGATLYALTKLAPAAFELGMLVP